MSYIKQTHTHTRLHIHTLRHSCRYLCEYACIMFICISEVHLRARVHSKCEREYIYACAVLVCVCARVNAFVCTCACVCLCFCMSPFAPVPFWSEVYLHTYMKEVLYDSICLSLRSFEKVNTDICFSFACQAKLKREHFCKARRAKHFGNRTNNPAQS